MFKYVIPVGSVVFAVPKRLVGTDIKPVFSTQIPHQMGKRKITVRPYRFWNDNKNNIPKVVSEELGTWYYIKFDDDMTHDPKIEWLGFLVSGTDMHTLEEHPGP